MRRNKAAILAMVASLTAGGMCFGQARPQQPAAAKTTRELIEEANAAYRSGDEARAVKLYEQARSARDFSAARLHPSIVIAAGDNQFAIGTKESLEAALGIYASVGENPSAGPMERALARIKRAEVMLRQDQPQSAKEEINAIRSMSGSRRTLLMADLGDAIIQLHLNQPEPARDRLLPLVETSDEPVLQSLALFSLGRAYVQLKQNDLAITAFRKLWNKYGETEHVKRSVYLVGQIYLDRGDFLEARKLYEACSVIGAAMQSKVRPGDELVLKVSDPNYFARTRSPQLTVTLTTLSGEREKVKLEKNPVSDVLYTGRIATTLATPVAGDGALQVRGNDEIEMTYEGQVSPSRRVTVVDDGKIDIDSVPLAEPPPRDARPSLNTAARKKVPDGEELVVGRSTSGHVNPGSPVYVQVVEADLDLTDKADQMTAQVVAGPGVPVMVTLTETGPHTGVFAGSVNTALAPVGITASSEYAGQPAYHAMDVDATSAAPGKPVDAQATPRTTYWKGKPGEKAYWVEIDLREPMYLGKLTWGTGNDPLAVRAMPRATTVTARGDGVEKVIPVTGKPNADGNIVELGGVFARYVRIDISKWDGDAPSLGQIILTDKDGKQLVPTGIPVDANAKKGILEFDVGQNVSARYSDDENETPGQAVVRTSRSLAAGYHNASLNFATKAGTSFSPIWRLDLDGEPHVFVSDPDRDVTVNKDKVSIEVVSESGDRQTMELEETGNATGVFAVGLSVSANAEAAANPRILQVRPGDLAWMTFLDEQNLNPGNRVFRHHFVLENRPTGGEFLSVPLMHSAKPYQLPADPDAPLPPPTATEELTARVAPVMVAVSDPDAFARAGKTVGVKVSALLATTNLELTLSATAGGIGSTTLDLVLGDKDVDRNLGDVKPAKGELSVAGDDLIRFAYEDARVPKNDVHMRDVLSEQEIKARENAATAAAAATPVAPVLRLRDPQRRIKADQDARLKELREQLNLRMWAAVEEAKPLAARRDLLKSRLASSPTTKPGDADINKLAADDALKATIAALDAQVNVLTQRAERLKAMGATPTAPVEVVAAPVASTEVDKEKLLRDGPLTPGQPFEIVIEDGDLTAAEVDVRIRSLAGRMVDSAVVKARRDGDVYRVRVETERGSDAGAPGALALYPGGQVIVDYVDPAQADPGKQERVTYVTLASDAVLQSTTSSYGEPVSEVRLGEPVFLQLVDVDADRSPLQDRVAVLATSRQGDALTVILTETEAHSGVFRGGLVTDRAQGQPDKNDDLLHADYGGSIEIAYADHLRLSPSSSLRKIVKLKISGGADGAVEAFSRQFRDNKEEMQLSYRTGQAAYQLGRRLYLNNSVERAEEYFAEATDYFTQVVTRFPEDPLAASANYYLGNMQFLKGNPREALERFAQVVARWPKSEYVARARFKIGQCHESLGQFEQAADAYVLLTYHHAEDALVPAAMVRMMNWYARSEAWPDAVAIAEKFVERFPEHGQAGAVALKAGQWLAVSERPDAAVAWFTKAEKVFATRDKDMPALLYWHAATLISASKGNVGTRGPRAEKVRELLNRVVYDYGASEYTPLAKIALEQMQERN